MVPLLDRMGKTLCPFIIQVPIYCCKQIFIKYILSETGKKSLIYMRLITFFTLKTLLEVICPLTAWNQLCIWWTKIRCISPFDPTCFHLFMNHWIARPLHIHFVHYIVFIYKFFFCCQMLIQSGKTEKQIKMSQMKEISWFYFNEIKIDRLVLNAVSYL